MIILIRCTAKHKVTRNSFLYAGKKALKLGDALDQSDMKNTIRTKMFQSINENPTLPNEIIIFFQKGMCKYMICVVIWFCPIYPEKNIAVDLPLFLLGKSMDKCR